MIDLLTGDGQFVVEDILRELQWYVKNETPAPFEDSVEMVGSVESTP